MLGAFVLWTFSGFKGKFEERLEKSTPISGLFFLLTFIAVIIMVGRII
jgi:hypothetical protein